MIEPVSSANVPAAARRTPWGFIIVSWILGTAGVLWAFLIGLASAMKTVPSMDAGALLMTVPLPVGAIAAATVVILRVRSRSAPPLSLLWGLVGVLLGLLGLLIGLANYADM